VDVPFLPLNHRPVMVDSTPTIQLSKPRGHLDASKQNNKEENSDVNLEDIITSEISQIYKTQIVYDFTDMSFVE
jgi:hypothetical protein